MPLIAYACQCGNTEKKFIRQAKDAPASFLCPKCNSSEMKKQLSASSMASKITVDNGVQAKAVEIDLNIIQSNQERANKDYSQE